MLVVTDIKVVNIENRIFEMARLVEKPVYLHRIDAMSEPIKIEREMVFGQIFVNDDGQEICIGMSEMVQKLIGLPMKVFQIMQDEVSIHRLTIEQLRSRSAMYQRRIADFNEKPYFKRLWFALMGRTI